MKFLSKVVWSEGMYLGPHQFQLQERYFEDSIHFATSALWFANFGLTGCSLDAEALQNGTVSIVHARGILPDGMPFHMPQSDPLPAARPIADVFPPTSDGVMVSLAIPETRPRGPNCALTPDANGTRYVAELRNYDDETTGTDERPVRIGRKNLTVLFDIEPSEGYIALPLARVKRDGSGHFIYDPEFVPPCLQISASEYLMLMVRRLLEILEAKSARLSRTPGASARDFSPRDLANFWLLHAVNSALAPLRHIWITKRGHPEELFLEMSRLAGALCTFALDSHPSTLPLYDHLHLSECFEALDRHIRMHLETIVPTNCVSIPLTKVADYFYEGDIVDTRCFGRSRWVFGIRSALGEAELITRTPQLVKVCSSKFVGELVKRAMAGLTLTHLPIPPPAVPAKLEAQYFGISKEGPFWDHIVQTHRVGIYVPGDFPDAELELLIVLEQ
jgi:type VI secretion system protein ImpJ